MKLNNEIVRRFLIEECEADRIRERFEKALLSSSRNADKKIVEALAEAIDYCNSEFDKGLGIEDPVALSAWVNKWKQCSYLLVSMISSVPSIIIEHGLASDFIKMTQGRDYFLEGAIFLLEQRRFDLIEKLFEAGYKPLFDSVRLPLISSMDDVSKCPRSIFEPFFESALACISGLSDENLKKSRLLAVSSRYLSCRGHFFENLKAFETKYWTSISENFLDRELQLSDFVQHAAAVYSSPKLLSLVNKFRSDFQRKPILLDSLMRNRYGSFGTHYVYDPNPFETNEIKYKNLHPSFFANERYFSSIVNEEMHQDFFLATFPLVVNNGFEYSKILSYREIAEQSKFPLIELASREQTTLNTAAMIMKLSQIDNVLAFFEGDDGPITQYIFEKGWSHLYNACQIPSTDMAKFGMRLLSCSEEERDALRLIIRNAQEVQGKSDYIKLMDEHVLKSLPTLDLCIRYLGQLKDIQSIQHAKSTCAHLRENPYLDVKDPSSVLSRVSWHSDQVRDAVLSIDLGL